MFFRSTLFLLIWSSLSVLSCKPTPASEYPPELLEEVQQLSSKEQKVAFLESLYLTDQQDRNEGIPYEQLRLNDEVRLQKLSAYLDTYGYPSRKELSKSAADTPYIILHHAPTNAPRHKYFPLMYQAMQNGDIAKGTFAFFLGRFQKMENGQWIDFDGPFTVDEEIDTLIKALDLSGIVATLNNK